MDNIINTFKYTFSLNQLSWIIFYFYKQNALITSDKKNRSIAKQKFLRNKNLKAKLKNEIIKIEEAIKKEDVIFIQKLLKERLVIWFKFFFARTILQRYCNIPAGLLVVKFEDYSSRMITECYSDKKLINIGRQQNDGSSASFKGDGLVNLFLYTWNSFLYGRKVKVLGEVEFNINTTSDPSSLYDDEVLSIVKNMEQEIADQNNTNSSK